jgi:putative zinc finger/helix-turn-helix YgiT family protein
MALSRAYATHVRRYRFSVGGRVEGSDGLENVTMAKDAVFACGECGEPMTVSLENHRYDECGLHNVVLGDIEVRRCTACGEEEFVIPAIEQLHRFLAEQLISKRSRLAAEEIRFLRKSLGWSGADFARYMGVDRATVCRWEKDKESQMAATADRLLRLLVSKGAPIENYELENLKEIGEHVASETMRVARRARSWTIESCAPAPC